MREENEENKKLKTDCSEESSEECSGKLRFPRAVPFIVGNEMGERFNLYGVRGILLLYLSRHLMYGNETSTIIYHLFITFSYLLCPIGAILADSLIGKYKTIVYMSCVYCFGSVMLTIGAIPMFNVASSIITLIGLSLITIGASGRKPCINALGGDQFKLPQQAKQMATFFSLIYFMANSGSLISTFLTPILREDVACFGQNSCYSLAFGVPTLVLVISTVVFVSGRNSYKMKPPGGNMIVLVCKTIGNSISTWYSERLINPRDHWLDYANKNYSRQLVSDVKSLLGVLLVYVPMTIFGALLDQQGSTWTLQATRMDANIGYFNIKPEQMQIIPAILILILIPLCELWFYPFLNKIGIRTALQKMAFGGVLGMVAFMISALVEFRLEKTYPVLPTVGHVQLRIFNGEPQCDYKFSTNIPDHGEFIVTGLSSFEQKFVPVPTGVFSLEFSIDSSNANCPVFQAGRFTITENRAYSIFMRSANSTHPLLWYEDHVDKPDCGNPLIRTLANLPNTKEIVWKDVTKDKVERKETASNHKIQEKRPVEYKVFVDNKEVIQISLRQGGVYTLLIGVRDDITTAEILEIVAPNSVNILWLIPQYVLITMGEIMILALGLEFSYSQAPDSMQTVLQACYQLTGAFSNLLVIIVAELKISSQVNEFLLFAGLMFIGILQFLYLARNYKTINAKETLDDCDKIEMEKIKMS